MSTPAITGIRSVPWRLPYAYQNPPSVHITDRLRQLNLAGALQLPLDRVNVLGDDNDGSGSYGHTGCVNALSWAQGGELLLSGGDDTTVRLWRMDPCEVAQEYPFVCRAVIQTGHRANIFNVAQLPYSTYIASVAGDRQIRIVDAEIASSTPNMNHLIRSDSVRVLRCHRGRVKRLVTEESPDIFLTVAEDGTVRQHDLRTHHFCCEDSCPAPLVNLGHELSTISSSPLTPYQFVIAGDSPYAYLYDRRHVRRTFLEQWGSVPRAGEDLITCVRRFGRPAKALDKRRRRMRDHITGVRVSPKNGHEVLLTYSSDAVYLYSAYDEPGTKDSASRTPSSILTPNAKRPQVDNSEATDPSIENDDKELAALIQSDLNVARNHPSEEQEGEDYDEDHDNEDDEGELQNAFIEDPPAEDDPDFLPDVPVILPRMRYPGAQNMETIKDVNFLGPSDEFVTSGSDDGNFFIWRKGTGKIHGIYEGDGSIVNVIEGHPYLPLIAVSGIDTTVKLFAPARGPSAYSRTYNADRIVEQNARHSRLRGFSFAAVLAETLSSERVSLNSLSECANQ
ncbi:hypothetical protein AX15_007622 [Amanita polypyramis BW_CC]|nr:hypothetical protein AX15_007622 [Amanita polypyramis BW_CC]